MLDGLRTIAPVRAVAGNTDEPSMPGLEAFIDIEALGLTIHVTHGHELGSPTPARVLAAYAGDILVYGLYPGPLVHREPSPRRQSRRGRSRRFDLRPTVARLTTRVVPPQRDRRSSY